MKLRSRLMIFTAAVALSANMAFAAIDAQSLADDYIAQGYSFVEVKQGPTQTKVEAIKGTSKVEVIYDNETGAIVKQESDTADAEDQARTGTQVRTVDEDFADDESSDDDEDHSGSGHDGDDDDADDDEDHSGSGHDGSDDDESDDHDSGDDSSGDSNDD